MAKQIYISNVPSIFNKALAKRRKLDELRALFVASGHIEGLSRDENDYIFNQLFLEGKVAASRLNGGLTGLEPVGFTDFMPTRWSYLDRPLFITLLPKRPLANVNRSKNMEIGKDAAIMYITPTESSIALLLDEAVTQYVEAMATMMNNLNLNKMPFIGRVKNDSQGKIVKAIIGGMIENKPYIMIPDDGNDIDVLPKNTGVPYLAAELKQLENQFYNDCLTILGIDNGSIAKKERVIVDEINANNAIINAFRTMYKERIEEFIEEVNRLFGTNYEYIDKAEMSEAVIESIQESKAEEQSKGEEVPQ